MPSSQKSSPDSLQSEATEPSLSLEQALSLQRELIQGFEAYEFQQKLKDLLVLHANSGSDSKGRRLFNAERQKLFLAVQSQVLPTYGFEGTQKGVFTMMHSMSVFNGEPEFTQLGIYLDQLLALDQPSPDQQPAVVEVTPENAETEAPSEIQVSVKHAVTEEELHVVVLSTATVQEVQEALAKKLGRLDISAEGRLVRKAGAAMMSLERSAKLGARRKLLLVGVKDLKPCPGTVPILSKADAVYLQHDLSVGFSDPAFQERLLELEKRLGKDSTKFKGARQQLAFEVQIKVLPKYGFEGSQTGLTDMMQSFKAFDQDEEVGFNGYKLSQLLRLVDVPEQSTGEDVTTLERCTSPGSFDAVTNRLIGAARAFVS